MGKYIYNCFKFSDIFWVYHKTNFGILFMKEEYIVGGDF